VSCVARPQLLLIPSYTELEWAIRPELERWAEVATFDPPGVGREPLPEGITLDAEMPEPERSKMVRLWRAAAVDLGLRIVDDRGWERFFVAADSWGTPTGVQLVARRPEAVQGFAIGHAALSHSFEGDRAPSNRAVFDAMASLLRTDSEAFIRYGISQMTQGGIDEDLAERMTERFPDTDLVVAVWESMGSDSEPIGDDLAAISAPLLFGKHEGCLGRTNEGFEDIVAAFPQARTVICPEACQASPTFAAALREFCESGPA
jgi:pimeloyl-ACP methyl ester carboxylesterase